MEQRNSTPAVAMPMVGPLQAHTNVRDVLAPLFSNGRSFSSLIDELSRHFRLEQSNGSRYPSYDAYGDDPVGVLEASSESQSTDSEAEVCASPEARDENGNISNMHEPQLCLCLLTVISKK